MHMPEMFSDHRMLMFLYVLMELAASVPNIVKRASKCVPSGIFHRVQQLC